MIDAMHHHVNTTDLSPNTVGHLTSYVLHLSSYIFLPFSSSITNPTDAPPRTPIKPSETKVHQIPSHPVMKCSIELPHSFYLFTALDGSAVESIIVTYGFTQRTVASYYSSTETTSHILQSSSQAIALYLSFLIAYASKYFGLLIPT